MTEDLRDLLDISRAMAWERAKGELQSLRHTFYGRTGKLEEFDELCKKFVSEVEDNGIIL
jgi:hypothetical protein